jgi:hypothetical protein
MAMKRQLIFHTHVNTNQSKKIAVKVQSGIKQNTCYLDSVSRDGLTLSCDTETLHNLIPNKASVAPKDPISLSTCFTLDQNIQANCRVIFARRLSKDQFIMELKFVDIDEQAMLNLDHYIERTLRLGLNTTEDHKIQPEPKNKSQEVYKINEDSRITYSKVA